MTEPLHRYGPLAVQFGRMCEEAVYSYLSGTHYETVSLFTVIRLARASAHFGLLALGDYALVHDIDAQRRYTEHGL